MTLESQIRNSLYAAMIGDALGVPSESSLKQETSLCALKNSLGYGRYDEPEGTWSDDTSLMLCTIESLCKGYNLADIGSLFCRWLFEGHWTAHGYVYDAGLTTVIALENLNSQKATVTTCGSALVDDNGNGALMRILPAALYFSNQSTRLFLDKIHEICAITHAHPRSKIACGIFSLMVKMLLAGKPKQQAIAEAIALAQQHYSDHGEYEENLHHFNRLLSGAMYDVGQEDMLLSGYVVDTLETSIWCFLTGESTSGIIKKAIEAGLDYDTSGVIAGALAGISYGIADMPTEWFESIARKDEIDEMIDRFALAIVRQ